MNPYWIQFKEDKETMKEQPWESHGIKICRIPIVAARIVACHGQTSPDKVKHGLEQWVSVVFNSVQEVFKFPANSGYFSVLNQYHFCDWLHKSPIGAKGAFFHDGTEFEILQKVEFPKTLFYTVERTNLCNKAWGEFLFSTMTAAIETGRNFKTPHKGASVRTKFAKQHIMQKQMSYVNVFFSVDGYRFCLVQFTTKKGSAMTISGQWP